MPLYRGCVPWNIIQRAYKSMIWKNKNKKPKQWLKAPSPYFEPNHSTNATSDNGQLPPISSSSETTN